MRFRPAEKALADLIRLSHRTGTNPAFVQGSGGNTSVKTDDSRKGCCAGKYMFIKASGTALKNMTAKAGWRRLRLEKVLGIIKDVRLAKLPAKPALLTLIFSAMNGVCTITPRTPTAYVTGGNIFKRWRNLQ